MLTLHPPEQVPAHRGQVSDVGALERRVTRGHVVSIVVEHEKNNATFWCRRASGPRCVTSGYTLLPRATSGFVTLGGTRIHRSTVAA